MSRGKALVLDAHSRAGIETIQSLGRMSVCVDAASEEVPCLAFRSRYVDLKLSQPGFEARSDFANWLRGLHEERGYDLIVPSTERALLALRTLSEDDALRTRAVLASNTSLDIALDKFRTWQLAKSLDVPAPDTTLVRSTRDIPHARSTPIVLKPVRSKFLVDGRLTTPGAVVLRGEESRLRQIEAWLPHTDVIQQDWVRGIGVGVEVIYDRGRRIWHFAHERVHEFPLTGGAGSYRRSVLARTDLLDAATRLLDALQWHGVAMVEFKLLEDGRFVLLEINPRLWGSLALAIDAGVDFPRGLLALARGDSLGPQPAYRVGYYTRDLVEDARWFRQNLAADHTDPLLLTRPVGRSLLEGLRPLALRESWDHFDFRDPDVTIQLIRTVARPLADAVLQRALRRWSLMRIRRRHERVWGAGRTPPVNSILFVCTGNIGRSAVAEIMARRLLTNKEIASAGLDTRPSRESPPHFTAAARYLGVDLVQWRSTCLTSGMIERADLVVVMDLHHYLEISRQHPAALSRTTLLALFDRGSPPLIEDPISLGQREAQRIFERVLAGVRGLAERLGEIDGAGRPHRKTT